MPAGGRIPPDGRPPQAKGVGKTAKRHDLEKPATPGLHDSDLQYGEVQRMEQAQRVAPTKKVQRPSASKPPRQRRGATRGPGEYQMQTPDPIQMAASRIGGAANPVDGDVNAVALDPTPWMPLLHQLANAPSAGGGVASALVDLLSQYQRRPIHSSGHVIDFNELDRTLEG